MEVSKFVFQVVKVVVEGGRWWVKMTLRAKMRDLAFKRVLLARAFMRKAIRDILGRRHCLDLEDIPRQRVQVRKNELTGASKDVIVGKDRGVIARKDRTRIGRRGDAYGNKIMVTVRKGNNRSRERVVGKGRGEKEMVDTSTSVVVMGGEGEVRSRGTKFGDIVML